MISLLSFRDRFPDLSLKPLKRSILFVDDLPGSEGLGLKVRRARLAVHLDNDALELNKSKKLTERRALVDRL